MLVLCGWVAWRLGAFSLEKTIQVDGRAVVVPDVFAWVDHPFHATRAHVLLEHLKQGEIPRWIGNHQGGYPAEFYPLGVAWLDVALWALLFGSVSIVAVHKLAVILIFLLPAVAYWMLARADRVHPGVAVLAMAIHVAVPGTWLNGGYTELVGWGLVTNVAGASLALIASVALARFVMHRDHGMGVIATLAAAGGAVTNPRSLFAVVIATVAVLVVVLLVRRGEGRRAVMEAMVRVGIVGGLALLLAAPVVFALLRYNEEYFFLHYEFYDPLTMFWDASVAAVSLPVLLLAIAGAGAALGARTWPVSMAMGATLALYAGFTAWVALSNRVPPLVEQLEAPRLMPYQRLLMVWFGAAAIGWGIQAALHRLRTQTQGMATSIGLLAASGLVLVAFVRPLPFVPSDFEGLTEVGTTASREYADLQEAVRLADGLRPAGTSIFVIGNRDDWWHHQLWAPVASDTPMYYDDWMWYWTTTHVGPYDYRQGHYFPNPTMALTREYFDANGIGAVVVTDMWVPEGPQPREAARSTDLLAPVDTVGAWDVYTVQDAAALVTNGNDTPSAISVSDERIHATFSAGDGTVVVRRNWFPRWEILVNGEPVEVQRRDDGYMQVEAPPGPLEIEARYAVTTLDWIGRGASIIGAIGVLALAVGGRRWLRPTDDEEPSAGTIYSEPEGSSSA